MNRSNKPTEHDIIVVGGGISGVALAYGIAGKGRRVTVLDSLTPLNRASRTNVGLIWCQSKFLHLPAYARWGFVSSRLYADLIKELEEITGRHVPVSFTGGIIPCLGEEDYLRREQYITQLREALDGDYPGNMITRKELEGKLPRIKWGKDVVGAAWCSEDGFVEPLELLWTYQAALPRVGVTLRQDVIVYEVQPLVKGYRLITNKGLMECERLVLAAGLANRRLARFAIADLPVYPDKGQVLLVERVPDVMPIAVLGLTRTHGGTVIIGFKHERAGHNIQVEPSGLAEEGRWALRVWPSLGKKRILRTWSGLRVMPEDAMAIYSQLPGHPNAILVNTHSAITMAAAHTRLLPDFLLGGDLPEIAQSMTLKRFGYEC